MATRPAPPPDKPWERALLRVLNSFETATWLLGPFMIACGVALLTLMTVTYFDAVLPALGLPLAVAVPLTACGIFLLGNIILNYTLSIRTPPGAPVRPDGSTGRRTPSHAAGGSSSSSSNLDAKDGASRRRHGYSQVPNTEGPSPTALHFEPSTAFASEAADVNALASLLGSQVAALPGSGVVNTSGSTSFRPGLRLESGKAPSAPHFDHGNVPSDEDGSSTGGWCAKCDAPKPPRTHHCHVCDACVLKMDHHCPWINNCVGFGNYPFFFRLLAYVWAGCAFYVAVSFVPFLRHLGGEVIGADPVADAEYVALAAAQARGEPRAAGALEVPRPGLSHPDTRLVLSFALCAVIGVAVAFLLGWHVYLVNSNQSSIEWYGNRTAAARARHRGVVWRHPWDIGYSANWAAVFGAPTVAAVLWPTLTLPSKGNGTAFPSLGLSSGGLESFV